MNCTSVSNDAKSARIGFTLIRSLIIIAIIVILATILFPVLVQAREKGSQAACLSNFKQIGLGIIQYLPDFDEELPHVNYFYNVAGNNRMINPATNFKWIDVIYLYVKSEALCSHPSDHGNKSYKYVASGRKGADFGSHGFSQAYYSGTVAQGPSGKTLADLKVPATTVLIGEPFNQGGSADFYSRSEANPFANSKPCRSTCTWSGGEPAVGLIESKSLLRYALSAALVRQSDQKRVVSPGPIIADPDDWIYLDDGKVCLGVLRNSGAAIGFLARSRSEPNLLNHYDRGRLVQQSYYGDDDGSLWVKQPWRYNPVQGGDYRGASSTVVTLRSTATTLYAKTVPRHWAGGQSLPECVMEQWITLKGGVAHVRYQMTYTGMKTHATRHQEIPAVFVDPSLRTLVTYDGASPWAGGPLTRRVPGWPNEPQKLTESWFAYVNDNDFGVGGYIPIATRATCYRYLGGSGSDCSYIAPLTTFALKPGLRFTYNFYLAAGSPEGLRRTFERLSATHIAK